MKNAKLIDVEQYIKDTIDAVDPSFQLAVSDIHRKGMMCALLGISKIEMNEDLRNLSASIEWSKAERFVREELSGVESPQGAPQFQEGLEIYEKFAPKASRLFSYLAGGRAYKGQFEELLRDNRPDLSPIFQEVVDPISDKELLEQYALQQDPDQQELLVKCVEMELSCNPPDSSDRGQSKGKQGESSLKEFLSNEYGETRVLDNIYITTKHKNSFSKKCHYIIQLPKSIDLTGMTTELDALVFEPLDVGDENAKVKEAQKVTVASVFEAKATLNTVTLYDALSKKYSAISKIFTSDEPKLFIEGEEFSIQSTGLPRIGVYGSKILSPRAAARRSQVVMCELMLSTSPQAVREALDTSKVTVNREKLMGSLDALLRLVQEVKPSVYVASCEVLD